MTGPAHARKPRNARLEKSRAGNIRDSTYEIHEALRSLPVWCVSCAEGVSNQARGPETQNTLFAAGRVSNATMMFVGLWFLPLVVFRGHHGC